MENNRECYHCDGHPELVSAYFPLHGYTLDDVPPRLRRVWDRYEQAGTTCGPPACGRASRSRACASSTRAQPGSWSPTLRSTAPGSRSTRAARRCAASSWAPSRPTGSATCTCTSSRTRGSTCWPTTPWCSPCSPSRRAGPPLRTTWLVHPDAVEGVDYDLATLAKVWNATNAEDSAFVARTQLGVQDPGYEPGPYSKVEGDVDAFVTWYVARMNGYLAGEARIDEIGRCGPSVSCGHGIDGGESQAQPVGHEGDHAPPRHRRGTERERLVAGAGGRAAARHGAADDPDPRAGGLPAAQPGEDRVVLGPELLRLARNTDEQLLLRQVARPIMGELVDAIGETVRSASSRPTAAWTSSTRSTRRTCWARGRGSVSGSRCTPARAARCSWPPSTRSASPLPPRAARPVHAGSTITSADDLRAELRRVREQRYAFTVDEDEEGLSGIATGIRGQADELLGVITTSGPTQRLDRRRGQHAVDHLLRAAVRVESVLLGGRKSAAVLEVIARPGG